MAPTMPPDFFGSEAKRQAYFAGWSEAIARLRDIGDSAEHAGTVDAEGSTGMPTPRELLAQLQQAQPPAQRWPEEEKELYLSGWSDALEDLDSIIDRAEHPEAAQQAAQAADRFAASVARVLECVEQMAQRSGPIYERARERSRFMSAAWRAAGRPRRIHELWTAEGITYRIREHGSWLPASPEQVDAWHAWLRKRDQLRRELRR
jgi:hypothetical protein